MLSISLILFILGIFGFILINTRQLISFYKENLNLIVEISETGTEEEMVSMKNWLTTRDFYKKGSFSMIPKEEAMQMMRKAGWIGHRRECEPNAMRTKFCDLTLM